MSGDDREQVEQENAIWPWLADDSMADQEPDADMNRMEHDDTGDN